MNDTEFETLLRDSAPPVTPVVGLAVHRERILSDVRRRRTRRSRIWAGSVAVAALVVGGGSIATAGDGYETPWGWFADNVFIANSTDGSACFQGIRVQWEGLAADDPLVQDAQEFVRNLDLESLDTTKQAAELKADMAAADPVPNEYGDLVRIELSDAELTQQAVHELVAKALFNELLAEGYEMTPGHEVSLSSQSENCN
ncbi:hypothetical protein [Microbacterium sp. A93]|uniref:hypothetical protein n=1 Tax=Microbacterium sp. A93 TaxID=3450716 RepID=UPI003F442D5C